MNSPGFFSSREVRPVKGDVLSVMHCACEGRQYAVAIEDYEGKQWMAIHMGGGRLFWTLYLLCHSLEPAMWPASVQLYGDRVEDVAVPAENGDGTVVVTELVGRERWVRVMRANSVTRSVETLLILKFERRELREVTRLLEDIQYRGGGEDSSAGELNSLCSSDDEEENQVS
jgi:hypothetical protein